MFLSTKLQNKYMGEKFFPPYSEAFLGQPNKELKSSRMSRMDLEFLPNENDYLLLKSAAKAL